MVASKFLPTLFDQKISNFKYEKPAQKSATQLPEDNEPELFEKVVHINRCAKVVKGGRRFSFAALVVVGDQEGNVGFGYGKAQMVPDAIRMGTDQAKKAMQKVSISETPFPIQFWVRTTEAKLCLDRRDRVLELLQVEVFEQCLKLLVLKMYYLNH